jgi:PAS domain S-box-containing protein
LNQIYLEKIIEIIPYFIFWKDVDLVYRGCNRKFSALLGKTPEEIIGKTDFDLGWEDQESAIYRRRDQETMAGHPTVNAEEVLTRPGQTDTVMLVNKVPLLDRNGRCIGVLGTSADITDLKTIQSRLKELEDRLAGVRTTSANIAHELRTPLAAIGLCTEGLQDYLPDLVHGYLLAKEHGLDVKPIHAESLETLCEIGFSINAELQYLNTIINMILMNAGYGNPPATEFAMQSMRSCVLEAMRRYPFKSGEIELIQWTIESDFTFKGHGTMMVHILFNLIKNSLYHIRAANKGEIRIWQESTAGENLLFFRDTGAGIPEDVLPSIFQQFFTTTRSGTGLGLAYCKSTMKSFGGHIKCLSKLGEFTQFELSFPKC